MPATPDHHPAHADTSGDKADGPALYNATSSRFHSESRVIGGGRGAGDNGDGKMDRRMSVVKNDNKSMLLRSHTQEFDHNRWLFESKGKYGIGNAYWQDDEAFDHDTGMSMQDFMDKPWKPLTRKIKVSPGVISPYRVLIIFRMIVLDLYLIWRIRNPNQDAMWLWSLSLVCEIWFSFSWLLDTLPKLNPINRDADLVALKDKFETPSQANPTGRSDLPGVDVFISTLIPDKESPLVTANTILSILAVEYPVEKLSIYVSDDGGAILTFEAMAEAVKFAEVWVPFCRKHNIEPRNPESYFSHKVDLTKSKKLPDFVKDRRWIKREYDEFKVRINGLPDVIHKRCKKYNRDEELRERKAIRDENDGVLPPDIKINVTKATWMADGTHWPGTWYDPTADHSNEDHAGILQIMSKVPDNDPVMGGPDEGRLDFTGIDMRLPMFAYVSREKRKCYDHNKKAGAMNALVRASAILSNGAFILNVDYDHYIYNSKVIREGMCYMMDRGGDRICYIQFPQRFDGIDPSDRYANHNTVFYDGNMRALDGLQGPVYVGTGCMFRRYALYGFHPPRANEYLGMIGQNKVAAKQYQPQSEEVEPLTGHPDLNLPKKFGNSTMFSESIAVAQFQGRPLADHISIKNGRPSGALLIPRTPLDAHTVAEAVAVISCWYEDNTEWGDRIGWIYGSTREDVLTGYRMHNRGWRSIYCITKRDAFRGTAPINLTDRLHQVQRWAIGSVEIFFSRNNPILASPRLMFLQRLAYLNIAIYPFSSIFLVIYCILPALSPFTGEFIVRSLDATFLFYVLLITLTLTLISLLEVRWSGIGLEEWWRNEQFWVIGGTSAYLAAVLQGLLKAITGIEIKPKPTTSQSTGENAVDDIDIYADLHAVKWTNLFIMPLIIIIVNLVALVIGFATTVYSVIPEWSKLFREAFFCFWVLAHMYPFAKGLMGRKGKVPTIIYVWAGLISITVSLLWIIIKPPQGNSNPQVDGDSNFTF
ncbi:cellulose synthase-like protein d1 [Phtheirospermum japonicum]|uniref:Cellulose synthase-like protein d1 n=1 Tax=Phtheirospermum japonicum TaxID=374723 RepID=A0A830C826_9LAMI|nr:cellulose synthase-like protein d1 [Phtheirospermum japonicum]